MSGFCCALFLCFVSLAGCDVMLCQTLIRRFNKLVRSGDAGQVLFKRTREAQLTLTRFISARVNSSSFRGPGPAVHALFPSPLLSVFFCHSSSSMCFGFNPAVCIDVMSQVWDSGKVTFKKSEIPFLLLPLSLSLPVFPACGTTSFF